MSLSSQFFLPPRDPLAARALLTINNALMTAGRHLHCTALHRCAAVMSASMRRCDAATRRGALRGNCKWMWMSFAARHGIDLSF